MLRLSRLFKIALIASSIILLNINISTKRITPGQDSHLNNIDKPLQNQVNQLMLSSIDKLKATGGVAIVWDLKNRQVIAMNSIEKNDQKLCVWGTDLNCDNNNFVTYQPGSVMKPLILGAALNEGVDKIGNTYYENGVEYIDGNIHTNYSKFSPRYVKTEEIIYYSLNTGAIHLLKELGGGQLNQKARKTWYDYLTKTYLLQTPTNLSNVEQTGYVRPPGVGYDTNDVYASSTYGLDVTVTPMRLLLAYESLFSEGQSEVPSNISPSSKNVLSNHVKKDIFNVLREQYTFNYGDDFASQGLLVGGKSGSAPMPDISGRDKINEEYGTYIGFLGINQPDYLVLVRLDGVITQGPASRSAVKLWQDIIKVLTDKYYAVR